MTQDISKYEYGTMCSEILLAVGGAENIANVFHCITRLRIVVKNRDLVDIEKLQNVKGIMKVIESSGQLQCVIGTDVPKVYDDFIAISGVQPGGEVEADKDAAKDIQEKKPNILIRGLNTLASCVTPGLYAIVAGGMIKGIISLLTATGLVASSSGIITVLNAVGDAPFYFMPFIIGYAAAKRFKVNEVFGIMTAGILMYSTFLNPAEGVTGYTFGFFDIPAYNYKGSIFPVILSVWVFSIIFHFIDKKMPKNLRIVFSGSLSFLIAAPLFLAFAANSKMVQEYNISGKWDDLSKVATTNRYSCSQGDGITMATGVGASLTDMDQIQLLYLGNTKDGQLTKYPPRDVNGTDQIIFINKNGERFVNEGDRRDVICLGVLAQPDAMFYMLESGDGDKYKDITDPEWRSADGFTFQYLVDNGYIVYDDTLEGLAGKLGMDAATLQKTVDTFNASVDSGTDEFGRTLFSTKLENGPWVATPRQACVHHTMGGVTIDTEAHVLDESGNVISGLYAAGEVTGGIHGANRLGGNAVVDTVVFGKLAADTLLADSK